jgi:hypothetical protein
MINYDSDSDRIFSSSSEEGDIEMDNINRIQAKMQGVSVGDFAKFIDFVNNEFSKLHERVHVLTTELVRHEINSKKSDNNPSITTTTSYNELIQALIGSDNGWINPFEKRDEPKSFSGETKEIEL